MTLRKFLVLMGVTMITMTSWAGHSLDVVSRIMLAQQQDRACRTSHQQYQAFISLSDLSRVDDLRALGVSVDAVFDGFVTARIPADRIEEIMAADGVDLVSLSQPLHWCNDSALSFSNVIPAHQAVGIIGPFDGQDVIVGIIDTGIDFNHINLCDERGFSRVRAVYLPADTLGKNHPLVDGLELPGSCYETEQEITSLTTDYNGSSHGTHTLGTAAGSYRGNRWNGVAPGADLVACGMPSDQLTDVNIANAVKYIFDYADRVGKPCVINMSIGSNSGPNDGTSFLCRVFSSMARAGRICVVSAGNDGEAPICFRYTMRHDSDTATTFLRNQWGGLQRQGYVSMWSGGADEHASRVVIVNRSTGELEYASPFMSALPSDSVFTITSDADDSFAAFYNGELSFASAVEPRFVEGGEEPDAGRFHSFWTFDVESVRAGHLIGLQYVASAGTELVGWCTKDAYFYTFGLPGATGGSSSGSISDLATTDSVISVGAYCSRQSYINASGQEVFCGDYHMAEIAPFSSLGPDERGIQRPDVCAPGAVLLSSANRYDVASDRSDWPAAVALNEESYPYYPNQGTSMSAPVVTGAIALMLQVNPSLTVADVREVLKRSSLRDGLTDMGNMAQWGFGRLDVWAAVNDVIDNTLMRGDVNDDGEVNIADVMSIIHLIIGNQSSCSVSRMVRADVNRDNEINISDMNYVINLILNKY